MTYIKQIALFLNVTISMYFFYYQLANNRTYDDNRQPYNTKENVIQNIFRSAIVFLSPFFHMMAMLHPSYCYRGHCQLPHHCIKSQTQENKKPKSNDVINQDINSCKNSAVRNHNDFSRGLHIKQFSYLTASKSRNKLAEEPSRQGQESANVNQFSNMAFLMRSSGKSISSASNTESPRYIRKSLPGTKVIRTQPLSDEIQKRQRLVMQIFQKPTYSYNQLSEKHPNILECQTCQQCQMQKYLRMKHCYRCFKCVHKYDHHCVLLNICIGEFNQKHYFAFLYAHQYNTILLLKTLLSKIKLNVFIDPNTGIQGVDGTYVLKALVIIILVLSFVLTTYLIFIHTQFFFNGSTTYQKQRKQTINFFRLIRKNYKQYAHLKDLSKQQLQSYHPFDYGLLRNPFLILKADPGKPIDWKLPEKQCGNIIQLRQTRLRIQRSKIINRPNNYNSHQQNVQSQSSNNMSAIQTKTKSRQSYILKSKSQKDKNQNKVIFRL